LKDKPPLDADFKDLIRAFDSLSGSRPVAGMGGVMPIPMSEIFAYANLFRYDSQDEREILVVTVQALDSEYLKHIRSKSEGLKGKPK
jgi:hypothetical protein